MERALQLVVVNVNDNGQLATDSESAEHALRFVVVHCQLSIINCSALLRRKPHRHLSQRVECELFDIDGDDLRGRWAGVQPLDEHVNGSGVADREHLDAAVFQIAGVPAQAELGGLLACGGAKVDTLHSTGNKAASGNDGGHERRSSRS